MVNDKENVFLKTLSNKKIFSKTLLFQFLSKNKFYWLLNIIKIEGGMIWENSIETCILSSVKQIASPGWMHETSAQGWGTGKTQKDGMGAGGRRRDQNGEHM